MLSGLGAGGVEPITDSASPYLCLWRRFLNRGNHEDPAVCCIFGFMRECLDKYDDMTFR
jgi:hypothetical protein